jgi:hypothetical protein
VARAQQGDRVRRIGMLWPGDENDPPSKTWVSALTQALAGLGWTDGRNVRWGGAGRCGSNCETSGPPAEPASMMVANGCPGGTYLGSRSASWLTIGVPPGLLERERSPPIPR